MLSATELTCSRGERRLFEGLAFALEAGAWLHVKGANGSGKTTLLRTLVGLSPPDAGRMTWRGVDIRDDPQAYRRAAVYLGHPVALKDDLTPRENLRVALALDGVAVSPEALGDALERVRLDDHQDLPARHLSAGQKRRVLLARLLLRPADLWVLDEPFASLDAPAVELLGTLLQDHLDAGRVAVITSHQPVPLASAEELTL
ncbi:MAG: cytochrome c biogenesis heme-transporting ATPase CcmA [Caldimonas sp.]